MWISKKRIYDLGKRMADLERQVQSQPMHNCCVNNESANVLKVKLWVKDAIHDSIDRH